VVAVWGPDAKVKKKYTEETSLLKPALGCWRTVLIGWWMDRECLGHCEGTEEERASDLRLEWAT